MAKVIILRKSVIALLAILTLASCAKEIATENETTTDTNEQGSGTLTVTTRTNDTTEGEISYPVSVYVFNVNSKCVATTTINAAGEPLSMTLKAGKYDVYAIAGADDTRYNMPTLDKASPTSAVILKNGQNHADLMASTVSSVTVAKGQQNTLEISLNRKVFLLQGITMKNLPSSTTAVTVTIAPLYKSISLNGNYSGQSSTSIALTANTTSGEWTSPATEYLLPATGDASITVSVTQGASTKTFSYTSANQFEANHRISIVGTYDSGEIDVSGTVNGATWGEDRTIAFTFTDENVTTDDNPIIPATTAPEIGTFYHNNTCFVVASTTNSDNSVTVTLMTSKEKSAIFNEAITDQDSIKAVTDKAIAELAIDSISGWRLPTVEELRTAMSLIDEFNINRPKDKSSEYFGKQYFYCTTDEDGTINETSIDKKLPVDESARIRAFTTILLSR